MSTHINSPVESIDKLSFHQLPSGKPLAAVKMARVDNVFIILGKNGRLYCNRLKKNKVYYLHNTYPWFDDVMRCLVKLGVITNDEMKIHIEYNKSRRENYARENAIDDLERIEKQYGLSLGRAKAAIQKGIKSEED